MDINIKSITPARVVGGTIDVVLEVGENALDVASLITTVDDRVITPTASEVKEGVLTLSFPYEEVGEHEFQIEAPEVIFEPSSMLFSIVEKPVLSVVTTGKIEVGDEVVLKLTNVTEHVVLDSITLTGGDDSPIEINPEIVGKDVTFTVKPTLVGDNEYLPWVGTLDYRPNSVIVKAEEKFVPVTLDISLEESEVRVGDYVVLNGVFSRDATGEFNTDDIVVLNKTSSKETEVADVVLDGLSVKIYLEAHTVGTNELEVKIDKIKTTSNKVTVVIAPELKILSAALETPEVVEGDDTKIKVTYSENLYDPEIAKSLKISNMAGENVDFSLSEHDPKKDHVILTVKDLPVGRSLLTVESVQPEFKSEHLDVIITPKPVDYKLEIEVLTPEVFEGEDVILSVHLGDVSDGNFNPNDLTIDIAGEEVVEYSVTGEAPDFTYTLTGLPVGDNELRILVPRTGYHGPETHVIVKEVPPVYTTTASMVKGQYEFDEKPQLTLELSYTGNGSFSADELIIEDSGSPVTYEATSNEDGTYTYTFDLEVGEHVIVASIPRIEFVSDEFAVTKLREVIKPVVVDPDLPVIADLSKSLGGQGCDPLTWRVKEEPTTGTDLVDMLAELRGCYLDGGVNETLTFVEKVNLMIDGEPKSEEE